MPELPDIEHIPEDQPTPLLGEPLQVETPVIQTQDLEHNPDPQTRVSNKGVKITPRMDAQEEEDAIVALEQIEKAMRGHLPG